MILCGDEVVKIKGSELIKSINREMRVGISENTEFYVVGHEAVGRKQIRFTTSGEKYTIEKREINIKLEPVDKSSGAVWAPIGALEVLYKTNSGGCKNGF